MTTATASTRPARRRPRLAVIEPVGRLWDRLPLGARLGVIGAGLIFAIVVPRTLDPVWQSVLFYPVGLFVILALGLNIVIGQAGMLDLGYVAFYAVGAYTSAVLTTRFDLEPWLALPFAVLFAMVAGVLLGGPTLRLRGDYLAIVTLGFGEIVRIVAQNTDLLGESRGITGIPHPHSVGPLEFKGSELPYYYLALGGIILSVLVIAQLRRSRVGRAWTAIREDEDAAELMGVPTFKMKLWAFAMGASTGGLAGWIYATKVGFINPDNFQLLFSILVLAAVVLGGMGSTPGVMAGAFAVAFIPEYLRDVPAGATVLSFLNKLIGSSAGDINEYRTFLFGFALVIMMIFRPQGLLPSRQRAAELTEPSIVGDETLDDGVGLAAPDNLQEPLATGARTDATADIGAGATGTDVAAPAPDEPAPVPDDVDLPETVAEVAVAGEVGAPVLELHDVEMVFGGVRAMRGVSLQIRQGEIFGIIGPNGAGKTTLFNCVTGVYEPTSGDIRLDGASIVGKKPHKITAAGIARTFQNIRLFANMSAIDNVIVGTDARHRTSVPGALTLQPRHWREEREGRATAQRLLEFVGIPHRGIDAARNLPYGDQRRLEIARAMATGPRVLLLDEPAAGMNPSEKRSLIDLIRHIRDSGLTVILIEHDMGLVMNVCDRIAVLDFGEKIAEGLPAEIQNDARVIEAYLGAPDAA